MRTTLVRPRLRFIVDPTSTDLTPGAVVPPVTPAPEGDEPLREPGKKALEAERTRAATAEKALADYRKEIEDSKKTAEQKAADDLTAARQEAQGNAAKALRYEVAAAKGLDIKFAPRLTGSTKEELEVDADALMALIPNPADPPGPRGPIVPTEGTGSDAPKGVSQVTEAVLATMTPQQINEARRAGRLNKLLGIN